MQDHMQDQNQQINSERHSMNLSVRPRSLGGEQEFLMLNNKNISFISNSDDSFLFAKDHNRKQNQSKPEAFSVSDVDDVND